MVQITPHLASWLLCILEAILLLAYVAFVLLLHRHKISRAPVLPGQRIFESLARRRGLAVLSIALLTLTIRPLLIPILGTVQPRWNDEYSYLLAADTFAAGRLTNPTHPMWEHFESFHIIQKPSYMSMYPPAQGLILAGGERLGSAWIGQLAVTAAMCAAMCWALQGWLPPFWAFFGGLLAVLRLGILSYWLNTYWAGSVVALGGILVLGALPRIKKCARSTDAILLALGLVLLANSRPYEGLVFSLPFALAIIFWLWHSSPAVRRRALRSVVAPIVLIMAIAVSAMGYYYHRVTGSALEMTYEVNRGTYATAPYFFWQTPRPEPLYHHAVMRDFYRWELSGFEENRTLRGFLRRTGEKVGAWYRFYLGAVLTIPLLAFGYVLHDRRMRFVWLALVFLCLGLLVETWTMPHYFAPATGLLYLLLLQGMRHLRAWKWKNRWYGAELVRAIPMVCVAMIVLRLASAAVHTQIEPGWPRGNWNRAHIIQELQKEPGKHLVIVRYGHNHTVDDEYVYNAANIDAAKVVWARDMGREKNQELITYFRDRQVWILEPDRASPLYSLQNEREGDVPSRIPESAGQWSLP